MGHKSSLARFSKFLLICYTFSSLLVFNTVSSKGLLGEAQVFRGMGSWPGVQSQSQLNQLCSFPIVAVGQYIS